MTYLQVVPRGPTSEVLRYIFFSQKKNCPSLETDFMRFSTVFKSIRLSFAFQLMLVCGFSYTLVSLLRFSIGRICGVLLDVQALGRLLRVFSLIDCLLASRLIASKTVRRAIPSLANAALFLIFSICGIKFFDSLPLAQLFFF